METVFLPVFCELKLIKNESVSHLVISDTLRPDGL